MALTPDSFGDEDFSPPPLLDITAAAAPAAASAAGNDRAGVVEVLGLKHNPGIFLHWTAEEQAILEDTLPKVALDPPLLRYAKIAMLLEEKTTRDVALRVRWMIMQAENGKRRKEDHTSAGRHKDKKQLVEKQDGFWIKMQTFNQISSNFTASKIYDNIDLLFQARDNIKKLLNMVNGEAKAMKQMPPLPVKLNEELANTILPARPRLNKELSNSSLPAPSAPTSHFQTD